MWLLNDELPSGTIYTMLKSAFGAKHVVAVFATFHQLSGWNHEQERDSFSFVLSAT